MTNNTKKRVLIVEDETKIASLLSDYLVRDGYQTELVADGREVADAVRRFEPALILLDLMLPGKDGLEVCRELRAFTETPIIMVTARVDEIDRLLGLELGADDYICKPFSPREVVARVRTVLRRIRLVAQTTDTYRGIAVDENRFRAEVNGHALDLTPVEFRMLVLMLAQPGRVFSREQLITSVYDDGRVVGDRTVDSHVKNLRRKVRDVSEDELIHSVYGVGYKLE